MLFSAIFSKMVEEEEEEVTNKFLGLLEIFAIKNNENVIFMLFFFKRSLFS